MKRGHFFVVIILFLFISNILIISAQNENNEPGFFQKIRNWIRGWLGFSSIDEGYQFKIDKENQFITNLVDLYKSNGIEGRYSNILIEEDQDYWDFAESSLTQTSNYNLYVAEYWLDEASRVDSPDSFTFVDNCRSQNDDDCKRKKTLEELYPYEQKVNLALIFDFGNNSDTMKNELISINDALYQINSGNKGILYSTSSSCYIPYDQMEREYYDFDTDDCQSIKNEMLQITKDLIKEYGQDSNSQCVCAPLSNIDPSLKGINVSCIHPINKSKSCAYTSFTYKIKFWTSNNKIIMLMLPTDQDISNIDHGFWSSPYEVKYLEMYKPDDHPSTLVPDVSFPLASNEGSYPEVIVENNIGDFEYKPKTYYTQSEDFETYGSNYKKGESIYEVAIYKINKGTLNSFMDNNPLTNRILKSKPSTNEIDNNHILTTNDEEWNLWTSGQNIVIIIYRGSETSNLEKQRDLIKAYLEKYPSDM